MDIRYFFVKDRVESGKIDIQYCPLEDMIADFFSKALQGKLFRKFRDLIVGSIEDLNRMSSQDEENIEEKVES